MLDVITLERTTELLYILASILLSLLYAISIYMSFNKWTTSPKEFPVEGLIQQDIPNAAAVLNVVAIVEANSTLEVETLKLAACPYLPAAYCIAVPVPS